MNPSERDSRRILWSTTTPTRDSLGMLLEVRGDQVAHRIRRDRGAGHQDEFRPSRDPRHRCQASATMSPSESARRAGDAVLIVRYRWGRTTTASAPRRGLQPSLTKPVIRDAVDLIDRSPARAA